MKQQGFILVSIMLVGMIISLLGISSLKASRMAAHFASNSLNRFMVQELAEQTLYQAEFELASQTSFGPAIYPSACNRLPCPIQTLLDSKDTIWHTGLKQGDIQSRYSIDILGWVKNSVNYYDTGGSYIVRIVTMAGALNLPDEMLWQSTWWQRQVIEQPSPKKWSFLAANGQTYQLIIQTKPTRISFISLSSGKVVKLLTFPGSVKELGLPLFVNLRQLNRADQLYLADDQAHIWQVDLTQNPNHWCLQNILKLNSPARLRLPIEAAFSANGGLDLYVATSDSIEAWQLDNKAQMIWRKHSVQTRALIIESKRLWLVTQSGFHRLSLSGTNRFTGKTLPVPLFYQEPDKLELEFTAKNSDYHWRLIPHNQAHTETLQIAGTDIELYPPQYEMGRQSLRQSST
ncbi:MAG: hypothetical protein K0Q57_876 [Gammaproteobacteria bacterium]|nr:hypothetical protein [Gammaproteobacteria bacterium]